MLQINVSVADATVATKETLTAGRVGLECQFGFSAEWDDLAKVAVFDGAEARDVAMTDGDTVTVPWECLASAGYTLRVGVYGMNAEGTIVIPTVWAKVGKILDAAAPSGEDSQEPSPELAAQLLQAAANALAIAQGVRADADAGAFIGPQGPQGEPGEPGNYTKPEGGIPEEDLSPEILASLSSGELLASVLPTCPTERVADGTRILAKITSRKLCAQVGYYYDETPDTLRVYAVMGFHPIPGCVSRRAYLLRSMSAQDTPVELTLETAPKVNELNIGTGELYSSRIGMSAFSEATPTDARLVIIGYDADGAEIERVYSSQYRYTLENGTAARARFPVTHTAADHIVDVGLIVNSNSSTEKWGGADNRDDNDVFMPLVSTNNPTAYNFVIPDSFFEGHPYGLMVAVASGTEIEYYGPNVYKAPEEAPAVYDIHLAWDDTFEWEDDIDGTIHTGATITDRTWAEIQTAIADGKLIRLIDGGGFAFMHYKDGPGSDSVCFWGVDIDDMVTQVPDECAYRWALLERVSDDRPAMVSGQQRVYLANSDDLASILPTVTASDNGKVLMVTNGRWAAGSIPSATGVSF